jgi:hypothetical protein
MTIRLFKLWAQPFWDSDTSTFSFHDKNPTLNLLKWPSVHLSLSLSFVISDEVKPTAGTTVSCIGCCLQYFSSEDNQSLWECNIRSSIWMLLVFSVVSMVMLVLRVPIQLLKIILRSYRETFPVRRVHHCVCPVCYLAQMQHETTGGVVGRSRMTMEHSCVQWSLYSQTQELHFQLLKIGKTILCR